MNSQLNDKIYDNSIVFITIIAGYCRFRLSLILENNTMSIIANKIITIITIIE